MSYKKPKCDCGSDLQIETSQTNIKRYEISSKGKQSKRVAFENMHLGNNGTYLICPECYAVYKIKYEKNKIVRGDNK